MSILSDTSNNLKLSGLTHKLFMFPVYITGISLGLVTVQVVLWFCVAFGVLSYVLSMIGLSTF